MAADDKSSSSTEFSTEAAVISPASPSHLTHFKPLTPEQDEPPLRSAYSSFVNLFRFNNRGEGVGERRSSSSSPSLPLHGSRAHGKQQREHLRRSSTASDGNRKPDAALSGHDPRTAVQLRTALKRLKEIMEGKSQSLVSSKQTCPPLLPRLIHAPLLGFSGFTS
uniref:Uncharacterized protein n=1 Tax=Oryzias latipes TaxID=8090 RepID=A0A3P9GZQ3_ORYLA